MRRKWVDPDAEHRQKAMELQRLRERNALLDDGFPQSPEAEPPTREALERAEKA